MSARHRFKIGDSVSILPLKRRGKIISVRQKDSYGVLLGNLEINCKDEDLVPTFEAEVGHKMHRPQKQCPSPLTPPSNNSICLDLHGMRVQEALQQVDLAINSAVLAGQERLKIVHGFGRGRIMTALHQHLASLSVVRKYALDPSNAGVTLIQL